jgi:hypothetical protein
LEAAEKAIYFVIPSEARNLSSFSWSKIEERFLASLGMTKGVEAFSRGMCGLSDWEEQEHGANIRAGASRIIRPVAVWRGSEL